MPTRPRTPPPFPPSPTSLPPSPTQLICKGGASTPEEVSAAYNVLLSLLLPIHGNLRDLCAMVFRHLASGLAAMGGVGGKLARQEVCQQLLAFAAAALRWVDTLIRGQMGDPAIGCVTTSTDVEPGLDPSLAHAPSPRSPHRQAPSAAMESVAALARAVVLRAADRADARAVAVELALGLLGLLDPAEGEAFVVFTARLSRTPKAGPPA